MIKHVWSVLCRSSSVDSNSNNISLFNVLESLRLSPNVPQKTKNEKQEIHVPIDYQIVSFWTHEQEKKETITIKLVFETPAGKTVQLIDKKLTFPADKRRMRDIIGIQGITVQESGEYAFKYQAKLNGNFKTMAELPLEVTIKGD